MLGLVPLFFLPAILIVGVAIVLSVQARAGRTVVDRSEAPPVDTEFLRRTVPMPLFGDPSEVGGEHTLGGRMRTVNREEALRHLADDLDAREAARNGPAPGPRLTVGRRRRREPLVAQR